MNKNILCYLCAYKRECPRQSHIGCDYDWYITGNIIPKGNPKGEKNGWYYFPILFDPIWMENDCPAFNTEEDNNICVDILHQIITLLVFLRAREKMIGEE